MTKPTSEDRAHFKALAQGALDKLRAKIDRPLTPDEERATKLLMDAIDGKIDPEEAGEIMRRSLVEKIPIIHKDLGLKGSPEDWSYSDSPPAPEEFLTARDAIAGSDNIAWLVKSKMIDKETGTTLIRGQYLMHKDGLRNIGEYLMNSSTFGTKKKH